MKHYYREHIAGYERVKAAGKLARHTIHNGKLFDDLTLRAELASAGFTVLYQDEVCGEHLICKLA